GLVGGRIDRLGDDPLAGLVVDGDTLARATDSDRGDVAAFKGESGLAGIGFGSRRGTALLDLKEVNGASKGRGAQQYYQSAFLHSINIVWRKASYLLRAPSIPGIARILRARPCAGANLIDNGCLRALQGLMPSDSRLKTPDSVLFRLSALPPDVEAGADR